MTDHDLLAGVIAGKLRLSDGVHQLYPARPAPAHPIRSVTALLDEITGETTVSITGADPLEIEASIGIRTDVSALEAARTAVATILQTLPIGTTATITIRISAID